MMKLVWLTLTNPLAASAPRVAFVPLSRWNTSICEPLTPPASLTRSNARLIELCAAGPRVERSPLTGITVPTLTFPSLSSSSPHESDDKVIAATNATRIAVERELLDFARRCLRK